MAGADKGDEDDKADDAGLDIVETKRMLARARSKPVHVAVGQGNSRDGGLGLLKLDPVVPPKALMQALRAQDPGASKLCFGIATVDKLNDPKLVKLTLNRRATGLDRRLRKALKGTGYTKVAIETA